MGGAVSKNGWLTNVVEFIPGGGLITAPVHLAAGNDAEAGLALAGVGADVVVLATAGGAGGLKVAQFGAKQGAKLAIKQGGKEAAKQAAKVAAKQAAKENAKEAAKQGAKQALKQCAKARSRVGPMMAVATVQLLLKKFREEEEDEDEDEDEDKKKRREVQIYLAGDSNFGEVSGIFREVCAAFPGVTVTFFGKGAARNVGGWTPAKWQDPSRADGTAGRIAEELRRDKAEAQGRGVVLVQLVAVCVGWAAFDKLWRWDKQNYRYNVPDAADINGLAATIAEATATIAEACTHCFSVYVANPECARITEQGTSKEWGLPQYQRKLFDEFQPALESRGTVVFVPTSPDVKSETDTHLGPVSKVEFAGFVCGGLAP